jgi:hypothetical protein
MVFRKKHAQPVNEHEQRNKECKRHLARCLLKQHVKRVAGQEKFLLRMESVLQTDDLPNNPKILRSKYQPVSKMVSLSNIVKNEMNLPVLVHHEICMSRLR